MITIDDEGDTVVKNGKGKTAPKEKVKRPMRYEVVMHQKKTGKMIPCVGCVLVEVFKKAVPDALKHADRVAQNGAESVYVSSPDDVKAKASEANAEKGRRGIICGFKLRTIEFTAEPL